MGRETIWAAVFLIFIFSVAKAETQPAKLGLLTFMKNLNPQRTPDWGWNTTSDPCMDQWKGVICDRSQESVTMIVLDGFNLTGVLDAEVCKATSLAVLSLSNNNLTGNLPDLIGYCQRLTHLYINNNRFNGPIPIPLVYMNLKRIDISNNEFSDDLPNMYIGPQLLSFLAQNNQISGRIPSFNFTYLQEFNVSNNQLTGQIPDNGGRFGASSFSGNPGLCGPPLSTACPPTAPSPL